MSTVLALGISCLALLLLAGCRTAPGRALSDTKHDAPNGGAVAPLFRDRATQAGITFRLGHGGKSPLNIRETIGTGCALFDYDRDGWLDLFLIGQTGTESGGRCALYRNRGDGTFEESSGPEGPAFWTGCATGDFDNDGWVDLLLTGDDRTRLYRNEGGRRFRDVTDAAGIRVPGWATSAQFADVDGDGLLDLYIARYVRFGPRDPQLCQIGIEPGTGKPVQGACGPEVYDPEIGLFFHNQGGGRFREATREFGLAGAHGRGLGVAFADFDADGRPDLYVANDRMPGDLFWNQTPQRGSAAAGAKPAFVNIGVPSGTAYGGGGNIQGGMGVDWADVDGDGRLDLFVTTFYRESKSLYRNEGGGLFQEIGLRAGIGQAAIDLVGFGTRFFDLDNDGWLDLAFVSGHVVDTAERVDRRATYRQPGILYRNMGDGTFREASHEAGPDLARPIVGRGLATGDWNNDGLPDLLITDLEGAPLLLENEGTGGRGHWLGLELLTAHGAPALGARVTLRAGGRAQVREVTTGGSYLSASDPRLLFGLGRADRVEAVEIVWPSGARQTLASPEIDRYHRVRARGRGEGLLPSPFEGVSLRAASALVAQKQAALTKRERRPLLPRKR